VWAGWDSVWEQEKPEARKCLKMLQNPTGQVHVLLAADGWGYSFSGAELLRDDKACDSDDCYKTRNVQHV
jgi:hypothetical protein